MKVQWNDLNQHFGKEDILVVQEEEKGSSTALHKLYSLSEYFFKFCWSVSMQGEIDLEWNLDPLVSLSLHQALVRHTFVYEGQHLREA
jgi:hypothetical protein